MSSEKPWTAEQHRDFASAIYEAGMRSSSPAVILHNMQPTHETITSERVKSHLQKYRGNRSKAKAEFMAAYDKWMAKAIALTNDLHRPIGANHVDELRARNPAAVAELRELMNPANHALGEMAAYLGFLVMVQEKRRRAVERAGCASLPPRVALTKRHTENMTATINPALLSYLDYKSVTFPQLTKEEMDSPLGQGLEYTRKLLSMISSHLDTQRHPQVQLNRKRGRSGQNVLMPSEKQDEHRIWGIYPARTGQSYQMDSSSGWHSSALGSGHVPAGDKANTDSTSGESISPQTSSLLEAVAQASAAMQPTWLPGVERGTRHQMHGKHHRSHAEKREPASYDENLRHIFVDDLSLSSRRFRAEEHMMGDQLNKEGEPCHRGKSMEPTQVDVAWVGDQRADEYGMHGVHHQHDHASEKDWSHAIQPNGRWEYDQELHGSLPTGEANVPWQSRNRHTNFLNEERRRQTNEVMSYRRRDAQQGGDTHAPAATDSTYPWGAPPHH
jgi:SHAQKYF class myb-like DNA-binding protein